MKPVNKLSIRRETLMNLSMSNLIFIQGGVPADTQGTACRSDVCPDPVEPTTGTITTNGTCKVTTCHIDPGSKK
jgi:hypothetical protein